MFKQHLLAFISADPIPGCLSTCLIKNIGLPIVALRSGLVFLAPTLDDSFALGYTFGPRSTCHSKRDRRMRQTLSIYTKQKKKKVIINKKLMELGSDSQSVSENS